jgi:hypothetical protein
VVELPGSGARLATHIVTTQPGVAFHDVFTFAATTWQDRTLVGLAAAALGIVGSIRVNVDPTLAESRASGASFTHVLGLRAENGGPFAKADLEGWFPGAEIKLV